MAELTSMLFCVCRWFDSSAAQLSLPLLFQNNEALNSSLVDHTSSLPAHSRSCRRSAPPVLHSPLQFNRLDFHLIPAEKHQLTSLLLHSHCKVFFSSLPGSKLSTSVFSLFSFPFHTFINSQQQNSPFSSSTVDFSFLFSFFLHSCLLICPAASSPSPPSATWTEQVSSPPDFVPTRRWRDLSPQLFLTAKQQLPHSPLFLFSGSAEQWSHNVEFTLLC